MKKVYYGITRKDKLESYRWHFWAWMMDNHPKIFKICNQIWKDKTLPF